VARVAAVWQRNEQSLNQLREVARAILLDPEARGDLKPDPNYGKLREPILRTTNLCRAFGVTAYSGTGLSDGALSVAANNQMSPLDQNPFFPPTVFSYYLPDNVLTGTNNVIGPEFQIYSTLTAVRWQNFTQTMLNPNGGETAYGIAASPPPPQVDRPIPDGTRVDLTALVNLAANPTQLVDELDRVIFGYRMSPAMKAEIIRATSLAGLSDLRKAKTALYLVMNAPEYLIQR
jgi:hypothetical protein